MSIFKSAKQIFDWKNYNCMYCHCFFSKQCSVVEQISYYNKNSWATNEKIIKKIGKSENHVWKCLSFM